MALLTPETYGATAEEAVYTVDGIYTFADGGEQRYARLYFSNGELQQVFGFTGENADGSAARDHAAKGRYLHHPGKMVGPGRSRAT